MLGGPPSLSVSNAYERDVLGHAVGDGLFWDHIVERFRPTVLEIDTECDAAWTLTAPNGTVENTFEGSTYEFTCSSLGHYELALELTCDSSETLTFTYDLTSKHVRYEIRSLSKEDREAFFDALVIVYNLDQKLGEAKYGSKYRSIEYLVREHLAGAADKSCDHWHDDAGILTHHMAFTLELEQSLQSIQPSVSLPYWDYTIDSYIYDANTWQNSSIFDDNWFGPVESGSDDHVITRGRWAYQKVMKNAQEWSGIHNPYGLLRSPWNTNPVPYIMRSAKTLGVKNGGWTTPDCSTFAVTANVEWIGDIFSSLNGELHGPIHIMIGGQWGYDASKFNVSHAVSVEDLTQLTDVFLLAGKFLWRQGYLRCPETCSDDTPATECSCSCPSSLTQVTDDASATAFLADTGLIQFATVFNQSAYPNFFKNAGFSDAQDLLEFICAIHQPGEMFTSAAPYDPTFWPLHGVAERFLAYKRIAADWGITTINETWGYRHGVIMSDTHTVCQWNDVTNRDTDDDAGTNDGKLGMGLPTCIKGQTCPGHRAHDLLPMGNFLDKNDTYTNIEWYNFTAPWNDELPYVYDSYSNWPGCTDQGVYFFITDQSGAGTRGHGGQQVGGTASHIAAGHMKAGFANDRRLTGLAGMKNL